MTETTLLEHGIIITVDSEDRIYNDGAVAFEDNRIIAVGETEKVKRRVKPDHRIDCRGKAVLPGFVNLHAHSGLIRGTAEDLPLWDWIRKHVDPMHRVLRADDAYAASLLCYSEQLKAGITSVLDMYRFMHRCADAAEQVGIRVNLAPYVADRPGYDYFESQRDNIALLRSRHNTANGRIKVWMGLEHLFYCSEEAYHRAREFSERYQTGIHTHGEESFEMAEQINREYGRRPIRVLYDRGILGVSTVLAHCVWLTPQEIRLLAQTGTSVAHCPTSNMKLASGAAPIPKYLRNGVNVGLGSDGIKENNRMDIMQEMKMAALLQKVTHLDATLLPANLLLRMATINGARALGLGKTVGSLEEGKLADIMVIGLDRPHLTPVITDEYFNVVYNIVYAAQGGDVDAVFVDGRKVVEDSRLLTVKENEVITLAQRATEKLLERREPYVPKKLPKRGVQVKF